MAQEAPLVAYPAAAKLLHTQRFEAKEKTTNKPSHMAAQKVVFLEAGISWTPKQHNPDCATTRNNQKPWREERGRIVEILRFEIRVSEEGLSFCRVCGLRILGRTARNCMK
jgi:hypothetical protein